MEKALLVAALNGLADELKPFTVEMKPGDRIWNGKTWAPTDKSRHADRYACSWVAQLTTAADLLDAQDSMLSDKQIGFLKKQLFGGMGSFADFFIDEATYGEEAKAANQNLRDRLDKLFPLFE